MTDLIVVAVLAVVLGAAIRYLIRAKKSGVKCIGCSAGDCCAARKSEAAPETGCGCGEKPSCCQTDAK